LPTYIPLILAGGRGTRISHLNPDLPKPAIPVAGKPFLAWILRQLAHAGFRQAVVSSGHRAMQLRREVEPCVPAGMEIRWVVEQSPLGTGGGAAWAARHSGFQPRDWLVLNGDSYLDGGWPGKILRTEGAALVARELADTGRFGRLEEKEGRLVCFSEKISGGPGLINAGIYLLPNRWLEEVPLGSSLSMEMNLFPAWLRQGRKINVLRESGAFLDIGTPESLADADRFVRQYLG
jgi:hypothetical protein